MNMKKNFKSLMLMAVAAMALSSCATIVTGSNPKVVIDGDVDEPVTISTSFTTYDNVKLPIMVRLKRKHLDGQRIKVTSENYTYKDVVVQKNINEWTFGNILLGGIIGWGIDLLTNGVSKPADNNYYIHGKKK